MSQWRVYEDPPEVVPIDDLREHALHPATCWCQPFDDDGVLVHNSADEREKFERGERLPS